MSLPGIPIFSPLSRSRRPRLAMASATALRIWPLKRRMKRLRLMELLFLLSCRRSTMRTVMTPPVVRWSLVGTGPAGPSVRLAALSDAQIPLAEQAYLLFGVSLVDHAVDEVLMLLLLVRTGLRIEGDDRQQVFRIREHALFNDRPQLLVTGPGRVLAVMLGAGPQHEIHDLVAEVLRVADAGRLLDLFQLIVERGTVQHFTGIRIAEFLILNPEIGIGDIPIEDVLSVLGIAFQIGRLDFLADELRIARAQVFLDETAIAILHFRRELLLLDLLFQHVHQMHRIGGDFPMIEIEHLGQDLESKTRGNAGHAFVDPGKVAVLLITLRLRIGVREVFPVIDPHLAEQIGVFRLLEA